MTFSMLPHRDRLGAGPVRLFIDGAWRNAADGATWTHHHPATNEALTTVALGNAHDVDAAVRAARRAFDSGPWPHLRARERKRYLQRIVDLVRAHADELTELQTLDNGMPISYGRLYRVSGQMTADVFDHYAGWIDKITGDVYPQFSAESDFQFFSAREPVGVVAGIIPWNAPLLQFPNKVAPALATGCCIVLKPSEYASLAVRRLAELIAEADLPSGVFNFVTGDASTGDALVHHPGVDKISFTGSRAVGERILAAASRGIKRVTLELGGKSAALVLHDARDVSAVAQTVFGGVSRFLSGQVCSTLSRALVHEAVFDEFVAAATAHAESVRFGDPFDPATTSAPLISQRQLDKVLGYVQGGKEEGARLLFGGERAGGALAAGNWVTPALFVEVDNQMSIAREEIFGPVLTVLRVRDEDEAIALANDSPYGLSAGVFTADLAAAMRVSRRLRTGTVGINGYTFMPNSPFGGFKESGLGREGGWASIEAFTEVKTTILNLNP
jgi:aldehyde dehydrogenase (NAD+)